MTPLPGPLGGAELVVWRLDAAVHAAGWDSGEGAFLAGGRWNRRGVRAVYCAIDPATAILEVAVHKGFPALDTVPHVLTAIDIAIPADIRIRGPHRGPEPTLADARPAERGPAGIWRRITGGASVRAAAQCRLEAQLESDLCRIGSARGLCAADARGFCARPAVAPAETIIPHRPLQKRHRIDIHIHPPAARHRAPWPATRAGSAAPPRPAASSAAAAAGAARAGSPAAPAPAPAPPPRRHTAPPARGRAPAHPPASAESALTISAASRP